MNPNLNTLITLSVILITIGVFIYVIWQECRTSQIYQQKLSQDKRSIERLENYLKSPGGLVATEGTNSGILDWITSHLDGQWVQDEFQPRIDRGHFALLAFPANLTAPPARNPAQFAPMLLTALGILGTFIGVSVGLDSVNINANTTVQDLMNSSSGLLDGMKTAFYTSVVGMGCAIVSMIALPFGEKRRQKKRDQLRHRLSAIATLETPTRLLARLDTAASREAAIELRNVATTLGELRTLSAAQIGQAVGQALQPALQEISQELIAQKQSIEAQRQELLSTLIRELRAEVIEPVAQRLDESAKLTRSASEAVQELKSELGGISQSLSESIQTIDKFQGETLEKMGEFAVNLQAILTRFQTETRDVLSQVALDVHQAVHQSIQGMEAQRSAFEQSANQASATFRGIREDLQAVLDTQAAQQRDILQQAQQAFTAQTNVLTTTGEQAAQLMSNARENLNGTLTHIDEMLQNTRETVQQELEQFRVGYQDALSFFFEQQNDRLSGLLDQQRQGLTQVVQDLRQVFQDDAKAMSLQIIQSMDKVQQTATVVSNLANTTGLTANERWIQLRELANTMHNETKRIEKTYNLFTEKLYESLDEGNKQLSGYLTQANELYTRRLEDVDDSAAKLCLSLSETSIGLKDVAEYLVAAADELKHGRGQAA